MKKTVALLLFCLAAPAVAPMSAQAATCDSRSCKGLIDRLYLAADKLYVQMNGAKSFTCKTVSKNEYFYIPRSHPQFSEWHGMLLGAFLSNRKAWVRVNPGQNNECNVGYVVLDRDPKY